MQKAYKDLDIQFLPNNNIVEESSLKNWQLNWFVIHDSVLVDNNNLKDYIPTEVLSGNNLIQSDTFLPSMNFMNHVHSFFITLKIILLLKILFPVSLSIALFS
jgi:hypothetical protein